uniref:Uncharacterized protein n=1 Tax=Romanomermis culicivorax TaxID=13658 RepID=A0A915KYL6_ROMCU
MYVNTENWRSLDPGRFLLKPGSYFCSASKFSPSTFADRARQISPSTAPSMLAKHARGCGEQLARRARSERQTQYM